MSSGSKLPDPIFKEFDPAHYLDSEGSIAAYLTIILEANDAALLAAALGEIACARGMAGQRLPRQPAALGKPYIKPCARIALHDLIP